MARRQKDPPGYPGDEAVERAFNLNLERLCKVKGVSREELEKRLQASRYDLRLARRALALRVRAIREARRLTRLQVARIANLPPRLLTAVERGEYIGLGLGQLARLCLALNYDCGKLFDEVDHLTRRLQAESTGG